MATGWSVMDALNKSSKAAAESEDRPKARFRTRDISIRKLYSNEKNFYSMTDIEKLAWEILTVGMIENLTVVYAPCDRGEYKIIAGERRWRALSLLLESGHEEFEIATCRIKTPAEEHEETVQIIMANAYRDKTVKDMLEEEKRLKQSLQYMKDNGLKIQGYSLDSGRLRDVIAALMNTTSTKIAQIESINRRLLPEFSNELEEGKLTFSAAYELSGMTEDQQRELLNRYKERGLTWKEVKAAKSENEAKTEEAAEPAGTVASDGRDSDASVGEPGQEEEWEQAHPEGIISLCYSCKRYSDCNVKTGTCRNCDQYVNKEEAEKTDEQGYSEEQDAIDRRAAKKLREREQEEKMSSLPSDSAEQAVQKCIRLSEAVFYDMETRTRTYLILKNDKYRVGDVIRALECRNGSETGNEMELEIVCMDDDNTSSALEEGWCVLGFR